MNPHPIESNTDEEDNLIVDFFFNNTIEERRHRRRRQNSSQPQRTRAFIERNREEGHHRLFNDYFAENSVYTEAHFRRRFRMRKHVFLRIMEALGNHDDYFQWRPDATGRMGLSPLQKCTAAIRMLAYGAPSDSIDDYVRIGASTSKECLERFVKGVNEIYGAEYLRRPNNDDIQRLLQMGAARGFPGMLGSIDCMHWEWKNCPVAWQGQFQSGHHAKPTIILEAVASQDLWIWHAYFGSAGSNNDINVLNQSNVFSDVLEGNAPRVQFTVNGTQYNYGYYLADGIYPEWATFVKSFPEPLGDKRVLFSKHQQAARKDVERAFGVLQSRFAIIRCPALSWHVHILKNIIYACIILHNMIVEDERHTYGNFDFSYDQSSDNIPTTETRRGVHPSLRAYLHRRAEVQERQTHAQLQADLVEHIWERFRHQINEE